MKDINIYRVIMFIQYYAQIILFQNINRIHLLYPRWVRSRVRKVPPYHELTTVVHRAVLTGRIDVIYLQECDDCVQYSISVYVFLMPSWYLSPMSLAQDWVLACPYGR